MPDVTLIKRRMDMARILSRTSKIISQQVARLEKFHDDTLPDSENTQLLSVISSLNSSKSSMDQIIVENRPAVIKRV